LAKVNPRPSCFAVIGCPSTSYENPLSFPVLAIFGLTVMPALSSAVQNSTALQGPAARRRSIASATSWAGGISPRSAWAISPRVGALR